MTGLIPRSTFYGFTGMHDSNDGRDGTWSAEADAAQYLRELAGHRHVVGTLDVLSNGPATVAQMTRQVGVGRRGLAAVLRILAAHDDVAAHADHREEYAYYPTRWESPYIDRRRKIGWDLYGLLGIGREDKAAMHAQHGRNYAFFDAPVGL